MAAGSGLTPDAARDLHAKLSPALFELLFVEAIPIRDAVDLARFLVETMIGFVKFSVARPKTVGGSIAIAAITKHEGFQWVQRQRGFGTSHMRLTSSSSPCCKTLPHPASRPEPDRYGRTNHVESHW